MVVFCIGGIVESLNSGIQEISLEKLLFNTHLHDKKLVTTEVTVSTDNINYSIINTQSIKDMGCEERQTYLIY